MKITISKNTEYKTVEAVIKQAGDSGAFEAVIATLNVLDKDRDIVLPGAFGDAPGMVLPAHDQGHVPLGKAHVEERGDEAVATGLFNLKIEAARDWHEALKFDLANPPSIQEWSWGFVPLEFSFEERDGEQVRLLQKVDIREFSPVLRGASIGTGTISAKEESTEDPPKLIDQIRLTMSGVEDLVSRIREVSEGRKERGRKLGKEVSVEALAMAEKCLELDNALQQLRALAGDMLPEEVAKAAARFLASETLHHRMKTD